MATKQPITAAEYQKKYGQPVSFDMPDDKQSRAAHGFGASIFSQGDSTFLQGSRTAKAAKGFTKLLGLEGATDVFSQHITRSKMGPALTGVDYDVEQAREQMPAPTAGQTAGAIAQTAATAAAPLIAPVGLPAQMAAGAALGYTYDVGSDMIAQKSLGQTLTPGMATAVGAAAPPVIRGAIGAGSAALGGRIAAQQADSALPAARQALEAGAESTPIAATRQVLSDASSRLRRAAGRPIEAVKTKAQQAARIRELPSNARPAVQANIADEVIDYAVQADQQTKSALRQMVEIAEQPKSLRPKAGPASVASDTAVDQFQLINQQRRTIGQQIGQMSDELPTLQNIDITPTRQAVTDVLGRNGIQLSPDGQLVATDNMRVSDEQLSVLNKIWQRVSSRDQMSAKNLHELDQWFSSTQRTARVVDKIEDMYVQVPTPDGETRVPIYKFFRDAFGQRLDEVAPANLRDLNRQYRSLSNLTDDIESTLVRNSNLQTLQQTDISNPAGLRRLFGEAQSAEDFRLIYDQMDDLSRQLGFDGPRADELYGFANRIRDYYPETIPDTGFRGSISSSIRDVVGSALRIGEVKPADQQRAIRQLLEMGDSASFNQGGIPKQLPANKVITEFQLAGLDPKNFNSVDDFITAYKQKNTSAPIKQSLNTTNVNRLTDGSETTVKEVLSGNALSKYNNVGDVQIKIGTPEVVLPNGTTRTPRGVFTHDTNTGKSTIIVQPESKLGKSQFKKTILEEIDHAATYNSNPEFMQSSGYFKGGFSEKAYIQSPQEIAAKRNVTKRLMEERYTASELEDIWRQANN